MNKTQLNYFVLVCLLAVLSGLVPQTSLALELHTRARQPSATETNQFQVVEKTVEWDPAKTAVIICDMWNAHWCKGATARVAEMAPRMNEVIKEARRRGMFIIHAPSDTMKYYAEWPQRKRAQQSPKASPPSDISKWHALNRAKEPPLPIDDSDGGCDDWPQCPGGGPWRHQIDTLEIAPEDAISDKGDEVYNLLQEKGRDNVIIMGVHENMCVLGRPFSIRQMVTVGKNVVLMRDMTDTMYNSRRPPYVSHFVGTDLVAEHIEKYWCATITSADLLGGTPFHFKGDQRPHVVFVVGENEYHTWETLPEFAQKELAWRGVTFEFVNAPPKGGNDFTNWAAITKADLLCVSVRRRTPPTGMVEAIRAHLNAGKPLVALRTASHGFAAKAPDADHRSWDTFDRDVLGGQYLDHYGNNLHPTVKRADSSGDHVILTGLPTMGFGSSHSLYRNRNLAGTTRVLLTGTITQDGTPITEPVAWINTNENRRVFYTSLGGPDDFKEPGFRRLLVNAMLWSLDRPIPPEDRAREQAAAKYQEEWQPLRVPGTWEDNSQGALRAYDGIAWYRCVVKVPDAWRGKDADLWIERIDNAHEAYVNGVKVGGAGSFPPRYQNGDTAANRYRIKAADLRFGGDNVVAVRIYDEGGRGGFKGDAPALLSRDEAIKLEGDWQFRVGDDPQWARLKTDAVAGVVEFHQVIDAAGVSARTYQHQPQENPLSPTESFARFEVGEGLEIEQVLAEPIVRQPVALTFDERGRLWVVQYVQYPDPAGLRLMSRDNVWRAVYDKVPPPPPHHFPGADKITIHEDTNGDGTFDTHKTFVEGLNIVTSVARGRGGVWIMNPPYLLFYADTNNDDIPDGDPEVRLSGFGLEDTHSVANSLHWGPDGWLYGCQGSTVTGNILVYGSDGKLLNPKPIYSQGQNIWRYQPEQRRYEVFSEGGGNAFGLEVDAQGRIFSGHNGGNTRGFHYVQGAYLQKGFEKHGPLSNPYAFGYFPAIPHNQAERFTHNFIIYDGGGLRAADQGKLFGVEPLQGRVVRSDILPDRSTFRTKDLDYPVTTSDQWFRPVDIKIGPDGAIYVADWYDRQVNHYRNHEGQIDKDNGRIYRLRAKGSGPAPRFDLAKRSSAELIALLTHKNKWFRQEALRLLADRKEASLASELHQIVATHTGQLALEALWALHLSAALDDLSAGEFLGHQDPQVRLWTVRLVGDRPSRSISVAIGERLARLAKDESNIEVRGQLASTAKRLTAANALPIVRNLMAHDEDLGDPRQPLLIWWALESKAESDREAVLGLLNDRTLWSWPILQNTILERLMRRYAMAGTRQDLLDCAKLFDLSPNRELAVSLRTGFEAAFKGRSISGLPEELWEAMAKSGGESLPLSVRRGQADSVQKALSLIADATTEKGQRLEYIRLFGEVAQPRSVPVLLNVLRNSKEGDLSKAVIMALQPYDDPGIGRAVSDRLGDLPADSRAAAFALLGSRALWSLALLEAVDAGKVEKSAVPQDTLHRIKLYKEERVAGLFRKYWGAQRAPTTEEMQKKIYQHAATLRSGLGSPYEGQKVFAMTCAACHKLFGQGGQIGPDLTTFKRDDIDTMLLNIVNPNAEIREGYENYLLTTKDGRTLSGFLADKDNRVVVLRGLDGENTIVAQNEIVELKAAGLSLMPEGLLDLLNEQQIRDLFGYLRSTQPLVK